MLNPSHRKGTPEGKSSRHASNQLMRYRKNRPEGYQYIIYADICMEDYWYIICVDLCMGQALGLSCGPRAVNLPPPAMPASEPRGGQVHPLATAPPQGPQGVHVARQARAKIKTDTITGSSPEDNRKRFLLFSFVGAQILICHDFILHVAARAWLSIIIWMLDYLLLSFIIDNC